MVRPRLTLVLLTSAGVSLALMQTLVIPALPFFGREFGASASWTPAEVSRTRVRRGRTMSPSTMPGGGSPAHQDALWREGRRARRRAYG